VRAAAFRELIESGRVKELASPQGQLGGFAASLVTAVDYLHAMRLRAPMRRAWAEMFRKFDLLLAPARSTVSYPIDKTFDQAYPGITASSPIGASNLVGVPPSPSRTASAQPDSRPASNSSAPSGAKRC
jgi:hypothetical protein